jgi:hypothetical protein
VRMWTYPSSPAYRPVVPKLGAAAPGGGGGCILGVPRIYINRFAVVERVTYNTSGSDFLCILLQTDCTVLKSRSFDNNGISIITERKIACHWLREARSAGNDIAQL